MSEASKEFMDRLNGVKSCFVGIPVGESEKIVRTWSEQNKVYQERVEKFSDHFPGESAHDFIKWWAWNKKIVIGDLSANQLVFLGRQALLSLEQGGWNKQRSLEVEL